MTLVLGSDLDFVPTTTIRPGRGSKPV